MVICGGCGKKVKRYARGKKCQKCYNTYMSEYMKRRYEERILLAKVLLGAKCFDCGSETELGFDHHTDELKKFNISKMWSYSDGRFFEELKKCVLRCKPCHLEKTSARRSVGHGGGKTGKKNCYCDECKPLKREYMRNWKSLRRSTVK